MRPVECHRHRSYWLASCGECREARTSSLLLPAVQSCTAHAAPRVPDQREHAADRPLVHVGRTRP